MSRKIKNKHEHQYNFDYNGDKIPIGLGIHHKKTEVNILKLLYRFPKDRHEDVKNPKKLL